MHTLCFVRSAGRILLGRKKTGFGAGKWNGFGGKVEPGETLAQAAIRELREESGLVARRVEPRGLLRFSFTDGTPPLDCAVFAIREWTGEPVETAEMAPQWFPEETIPYDEMWADDRWWLPVFLAGKCFQAEFAFADQATIVSARLVETDVFMPDAAERSVAQISSEA